jgi:phenylpropionate dioxygenase-like ring-hydroxylating dioxygenase large terminal subunit
VKAFSDLVNDPVLAQEWMPIAEVDKVPCDEPVPVLVMGVDLVVWRCGGEPLGSSFHVLSGSCLHRGSSLGKGYVEGGLLRCPYHGYGYDADGGCVHIPSTPEQEPSRRLNLQTASTKVEYGLLWINLAPFVQREAPERPPHFEEFYRSNTNQQPNGTPFEVVPAGPWTVEASFSRIVENFLDVAHFPFVHEGLLGSKNQTEVPDFTTEENGNAIRSTPIEVFQPDGDGSGVGSLNTYVYEILSPLFARFAKQDPDGNIFAMYLVATPLTATQSVVYSMLAFNYDVDPQAALDLQEALIEQDRAIVEDQKPELVPLSLSAEVSLKADRMGIAYRKMLKERGITYITST